VKGTDVSTRSLAFHIAYTIDTLNTFTFTSPLHASDVNRSENENLTIRWKTFLADTNLTGNLYISYNNGTTWLLLKESHKLITKQYQWQIKDTNSVGLFKMALPMIKIFSKNTYDKFAFFIEVMQKDTIAPQIGEMTFENYVKIKVYEQTQKRG